MKKIYKKISLTIAVLLVQNLTHAQCGSPISGGSATNMFTLIDNGTSSIAANKALNTITFIHRNNAATFGGSSGNLRFDYSTDGGTTWTLDQGVINPANSNFARYPNIAIYNPPANTNTANAYISYMAPTIHTSTSAWNGEVTGVSMLNVTGVTESYNQNGIGTTWQAVSLVNGAPGVFWAVDPVVPAGLTGFNIYKGTWSSSISDIVWGINYVCSPTFSIALITDYSIGFDPTGQIGYFCFLGHVTPGPSESALYPVLYKTTNGGSSWTGPIQVDLTKFGCITSNTTSPNVPSANTELDLVVDMYGNPHILTTLGNASSYNFNYSTWHHMYDITLKNGLWMGYDLGNVNGGPYTSGVSPNFATQWQAPQASRTADGSKVFFTWTDNSNYSLGSPNSSPNLFGKSFDVVQNTWTQTKDFTSCNSNIAGKLIFPHMAAEILEPSSNTFKMAIVYGEMAVTNDLGQTANFKFLDNATFLSSEYTVAVAPATVTIQQAPTVVICPNSTLTINVSGNPGEVLWNTGATASTLAISSGTATTYSVIAQVGCNVGTASVAVVNLSVNPSVPGTGVCPGNPLNVTVTGNALGYTWTPGPMTGTNVTLNPITNPVTLTAIGSNSCTSIHTLNVNLLPQPTLSIAGNNTICAGTVLSQTVSGAQSYSWDNGATGATFTDTPLVNTSYTVTGTAANTCTNIQTVSVVVKPSPTITAVSSASAVCAGQTVALMSSGAITYSWNTTASSSNITVTVSATSVYTVTGAGANLCESSKTVAVIAHPLPSLTVTPTKPIFCKGEKTKLTATGANSYTWVAQGLLTSTMQVNPTTNTTYSLIGKSTQGCVNTSTYTLIVDQCTGLEQLAAGNYVLSLYPNPNNGSFTIRGDADMNLDIVNELGQVVRTVYLNEANYHETSVRDLASGIYVIVGKQENLTVKHKIIVSN